MLSLILILATQIANNPQALPFFQDESVLAPAHNQLYPFHNLDENKRVSVSVQGDGNSDLDCYVLVNKRIVEKDESNKDACSLSIIPRDGNITVWILNNGKNNDRYSIKVYR